MAADVILWRRKNATIGILVGEVASWVVFELSGYTLLSLVSSVVLLLLSIFFAWAKAAGVLGRPPPPLPRLYLSEEMINGTVNLLGSYLNKLLSVFRHISLAKDSELFYKVAAGLWLTSIIASFTDFLTLCYISLALVLTLPAIYEKCEYLTDGRIMFVWEKMQHMYERLNTERFGKVTYWNMERSKLY